MTDEKLEKSNELKAKIKIVKRQIDYVNEGAIKIVRSGYIGVYSVDDETLKSTLKTLVLSHLNKELEKLEKEFEEL